MTTARSGRDSQSVTLDSVRLGEVGIDDVRIHPDTLEYQATVAEAHANPQLAANLRRAAELSSLADAEVMAIYEALRPRRSTATELEQLAQSLSDRGAIRNAALIREAAQTYERRGLLADPTT
ncbi:MAG: diol dehydratase small subunit [Actinomycetes bacterium]|jgi:propanediol dehydratase small subunit